MMNQRIGSFIASLRKELNLTQETFAEQLGVSNRSVSRWENGKTLPDFALMQSICTITGVTLPELLQGRRSEPSEDCKRSVVIVLDLWQRERQAKSKKLNAYFALGFVALIAAILAVQVLNHVQIWLLLGLGIFFQGLGFYHNNHDPVLTDREKKVLAATGELIAMSDPLELLAYASKSQSAAASQYRIAFHEICKKLSDGEKVLFCMVADEYSIDGAPGIWHSGIAVTQDRLFLCGETIAGRFMTRTVMDIYDKKEIRSVRVTNRSIIIITQRGKLAISGKDIGLLGDNFKAALDR